MAAIYATGVVATFTYNYTMVGIAQHILKDIRDDMFSHMQTLPIRYFDTHTHGDIMSYYTNDTDTLRQMIAQSIPQIISSCFSVGERLYSHGHYILAAYDICPDIGFLCGQSRKEDWTHEFQIFF